MPRKTHWRILEKPLTKEETRDRLKELKGWQLVGSAIKKNYQFETFGQAIDFINGVAKVASEVNHHPNIQLWNISNVKLTLTTLCEKNLSILDFFLATKINQLNSHKMQNQDL